ncbi:MAG: adenylyltransferase/cytidyltransferase family protein, partial [Actinomadura rubrobrunea]|nr:adenylyltransferase/cytidyltransferase family protein [Actinomadura rubrobrunea]
MHGVIGFTSGVFDLFHVGHLDVLRRSAELCDRLVVGVCADELAERLYGVPPLVPLLERMEIVANVRHVDDVVALEDAALLPVRDAVGFDVVFAGADSTLPEAAERELAGTGVRVVRFAEVVETSSPVLRERVRRARAGAAASG